MKKRNHRHRAAYSRSQTSGGIPQILRYSVIIPTYNRLKSLKECLQAVFHQSVPLSLYEVIVVDDGSRDGTKEYLETFVVPKGGTLRVLSQSNQGCASARNGGIMSASGDILFFTDDDCVVPYEWMATLLQGFEKHTDVVGVGGWYRASEDMLKRNMFARLNDAIERMFYGWYETHDVYANVGVNPCGNTANVAYKKSVFKQIGLFDAYTKKTAMIDYEFALRVSTHGLFTYFVPLVILHTKKLTFLEYVQKSLRYGMADEYLSRKYPGRHQRRMAMNVFWYMSEIRKWDSRVPAIPALFFLLLRVWGGARAAVRPVPTRAVPLTCVRRKHVETFPNGVTQETEYIEQEEYAEDRTMLQNRLQVYAMLEGEHETPLVSVIVPFYNRPEYVTQEFIASLNKLCVSNDAIELIFVDDGSTDSTLTVLREAQSQFRFRTTVLTRENGGPSAARNTGIRAARGAYLAFTDSDVLVPSLWLHALLFPFLLNSRVVVSGGSQLDITPTTPFDMWRNSTIIPAPLHFTNQFNARPYDSAHLLVSRERLADSSLLFFDESFRLPGGEDMDYTMRMKQSGGLAAFVPQHISNKRSMNLTDFLKLCLARSIGINKVKEKHRNLAPYIPGYFTPLSVFSTWHMLLHLVRRPKDRTGLLMHIFLRTINSTPSGRFYALVSAIVRHKTTHRA